MEWVQIGARGHLRQVGHQRREHDTHTQLRRADAGCRREDRRLVRSVLEVGGMGRASAASAASATSATSAAVRVLAKVGSRGGMQLTGKPHVAAPRRLVAKPAQHARALNWAQRQRGGVVEGLTYAPQPEGIGAAEPYQQSQRMRPEACEPNAAVRAVGLRE